MIMEIKLSIITINLNNCSGLKKTINSVINQTYTDFEYIIIDGGSTDGSIDIIQENSERITYWISEADKGIYNAMNKGIDIAKGNYCLFMNSGDSLYNSTTLEKSIVYLDGTDIILGDTLETDGRIVLHKKNITFKTLYSDSLSHQSSFIKTSLLKKYHYDESLKIVSDWKFFLQTLIIDNSTYKGIPLFISIYDISGITNSNFARFIEERNFVVKKMFPLRILENMDELIEGNSWEDKLYIKIKSSKYHKVIYNAIVVVLKVLSLRRDSWITKFPNKI